MNAIGRILIVNADDFGRSHGINRGVARAHQTGIVTSASLMVRWPAASEAASYAAQHPELSLGIHVDLAEWDYVDDAWVATYARVDHSDPRSVADELDRQLALFRSLTGRDPTHMDSHQHLHRRPTVQSVFRERADRLGVPLRECASGITYCGHFFGQSSTGEAYPEGITADALIAILESLPPGITELACHPGLEPDFSSPYREERALEVRALCDDRVAAALRRLSIQLRSFRDLGPLTTPA